MFATTSRLKLRRIHLAIACGLVLFVAAHLLNHLAAIGGVQNHIDVMESLRIIYRHPLVEGVLLIAVATQVYLGLRLFLKARAGAVTWLARMQIWSGAYLAFFLLIHVSAVLSARYFNGLDTNFYFAAAGIHAGITKLFFIPYYFLAVLAIFTHLGCAAYWLSGGPDGRIGNVLLRGFIVTGILVSLAITAALMGVFEPIIIPPVYLQTYSFVT